MEGHTTVSFKLFGVTQVFSLFLLCLFVCFLDLPKMAGEGGGQGEEKHTGILIPKQKWVEKSFSCCRPYKRTKSQVYKLLNLRIAEYLALLFLMANSGT